MAQMVKDPPEMRETWVQSLGWEEPLVESMQPTPHRQRSLAGSPWGCKEADVTERLSTAQHRKEHTEHAGQLYEGNG